MSANLNLIPAEVAGHATAGLEWKRLTGSDRFSYPIDYSIALLGFDRATQRAEFLVTWEPGAFCHFHQHVGATSSRVIGGELHVFETGDLVDLHRTRKPGHESANDGGDVHMEQAGPEGAAVYYDMQAKDGRLFDILADDRRVLRTLMFDNFVCGNY
ncbi:MAG: hypothetical protein VYB54_11680 [Pseudomonadota bacterium]|nr:hypothetical protein [Pseudomonadota bacterium]